MNAIEAGHRPGDRLCLAMRMRAVLSDGRCVADDHDRQANLEGRTSILAISGFQMHLAKPIDPAELIVAVAALAKRPQNPTA